MPKAIHYIEERHRVHGIQRVTILCQACFDGLPADMQKSGKDKHGYETIVRLWNGPERECMECGDDLAPEFRGSPKVPAIVAVLFALLLPSLAQAQTAPIIVGNALDLIATEAAINTGKVREANPFMGANTAQRVLVKSASTALQVWLVRRLEQRHPRAATIIGYSVGAAMTGLAVRSYRLTR